MPVGCARSGHTGEKNRHFPSHVTERRGQRIDCARRDSRRDGNKFGFPLTSSRVSGGSTRLPGALRLDAGLWT